MKLKDILKKASVSDYALGHFNFSTLGILRAIVQACEELKSPVFVGTSEGEAKYPYHQQEALWNRIFVGYMGDGDKLENLIKENLLKGYIALP